MTILTAVSDGSKLNSLDISDNDLSGVDPELLAKTVTKLQTLEVTLTKLTHQQAVAIFTAVSEGSKLSKLDIGHNDLSGLDPGLVRKAVTNMKTLWSNNS